MDLNTLFKQCMYFCIVLLIFTFALNFISTLWFDVGAIPASSPMGASPNSTANATFMSYVQGITGLSGGFSSLFILASVGTGLAAVVLSALSHQTTPLAIYLFGVIFWTSWIRAFASIPAIPPEISIIFTVAIMFVFAGAVVAMLGYSG
jgi:hypothetical protein